MQISGQFKTVFVLLLLFFTIITVKKTDRVCSCALEPYTAQTPAAAQSLVQPADHIKSHDIKSEQANLVLAKPLQVKPQQVKNQQGKAQFQRFESSARIMGTRFRVVFYTKSQALANFYFEGVFQRIRQIDAICSDYQTESELLTLCRTAGKKETPTPVSDDLWNVLVAAVKIAEQSGGAFDITAGPYIRQWRRARRNQKMPTTKNLLKAGKGVGYRKMRLDAEKKTVLLTVPKMRLDLGGIAKGYAADEALRYLANEGVTRAMIDAGGDLVLGDAPPGKKGWTIAVAALDTTDRPDRFLTLHNVGVATSGDAFQYVEIGGKRYSHLLDPRTGIALSRSSSVTVIAPSGMLADALASALSVLDPVRGIALAEKTPGVAAIILRQKLSSSEETSVLETPTKNQPKKEVEIFESKRVAELTRAKK